MNWFKIHQDFVNLVFFQMEDDANRDLNVLWTHKHTFHTKLLCMDKRKPACIGEKNTVVTLWYLLTDSFITDPFFS